MTEHDPDQEAVRRLLGEVPPAGPVPDDVAARLDARLAELVVEREAAIESPVAETGDDELAQARRRRRFRIALVAAASVSVLGLGLGTVLDDLSPGGVAGSAEAAFLPTHLPTFAKGSELYAYVDAGKVWYHNRTIVPAIQPSSMPPSVMMKG